MVWLYGRKFKRLIAKDFKSMRSSLACLLLAMTLGGLCLGTALWGQNGYSIQSGKVIIDSPEHWSQWQSVAKTIRITDEGVQPVFIRKSTRLEIDGEQVVVPGINAVLNAAELGGGVRGAGSNFLDAANLMDGRMDTYWEPNLDDPLRDWWVQLDLGRIVSASKIVLKFVGEDLGDPFLQFKVSTSQGEQVIGPLIFRKRFSTNKPIKNERVFEIDLIAQLPTKWPDVRGDFTGDVIKYMSIGVTDSDFGKARQVSQTAYESLEPDKQGDIEYFRQETSGTLRLLEDKEDWDALEGTDRQGPVVYYRRELPRLAEVEVWSIGDNIGIGVLERGGNVSSFENNGAEGVVVDGDIYSQDSAPYWPAQGGYNPDRLLPSEPPVVERELIVDLAGAFFLDNIRTLQASSSPPGAFRAYRVQLSDGSTNAGGSLAWHTIGGYENIGGHEKYHDFKFPITKVKYFSFTYRLHVRGGRHGLSEVQLFGEGFMPETQITSTFGGTSPFIELGNNVQNLASIEWDADLPPGTDIILQTRTGDTVERITKYFTKTGDLYPGTEEEAAEAHATQLKFFGEAAVGPVVPETIPGSDWSGWSQRYFNSGDRITSPSPRKFVAVRATLLTDSPLVAPILRSVGLNFVTPVNKTVVGEVLPFQLEKIGTTQKFSYFIRSTFEANSRGFDDILIEAPGGVKMQFKQATVDVSGQTTQTYTATSEGFEVVADDADSLWVRLPAPIKTTTGSSLIELQFEATIFGFATFFNGSTGHSAFENSWQRVDDGDANGINDSERTAVLALKKGEVLGDIDPGREIITPNGDGINDAMEVSFSLLRVSASTPLLAQIYDLSGQLVRELRNEPITAGKHIVAWTGVDAAGSLVPPGIYLLRIDIDADSNSSKETTVNRLVHVAY
jgi:hypothetical protein